MDDQTTIVEGTLPWTDRTQWMYPAADEGSLMCWFKLGPIDIDPAIEAIRPYMKGWRTCIQAGGALGIWPIRLAQVFNRVITFEPEPVNWLCLNHNIEGIPNIECHKVALGQDHNTVHMDLEQRYIGHCGAWQVVPGGDIQTVMIDDMELTDVDLIYLDIEGSEHPAFTGGLKTIRRCKPVIGFEDKGFSRRYNDGAKPETLLRDEGYRVLARIGRDVLMIPC